MARWNFVDMGQAGPYRRNCQDRETLPGWGPPELGVGEEQPHFRSATTRPCSQTVRNLHEADPRPMT